MILFAYAGNMDVEEFSNSVPSAKKICIGKLPGYNFTFSTTAADDSSKANISPSFEADAAVWGVLIEVNDEEKDSFFNPDPNTNDLQLELLSCLGEDGEIYQAHVFTTKPHAINTHILPYDWYHERIIKLAVHAGLPVEYIGKISGLPFKPDPDEQRAEKRRKKFRL